MTVEVTVLPTEIAERRDESSHNPPHIMSIIRWLGDLHE
jgi:hypothetical protein